MTDTIVVEKLCMSYGPISVLHDIDCRVADRETFVIIGPNGAGKTTLFKCLTGEAIATSGLIKHRGDDITRLSPSDRVKRGIGRTFQVARVFPELSVLDNIAVAVEARRRMAAEGPMGLFDFRPSRTVRDAAAAMVEDIGLSKRADIGARFLSHGDRKRLELSIVLALRPMVLMMDEPTAGMSPTERNQTIELLVRIRRDYGITILLTEHDMDVVFGLADRIMVLNQGRVIAVGSVAEVRGNPAVHEVYLGEELTDA